MQASAGRRRPRRPRTSRKFPKIDLVLVRNNLEIPRPGPRPGRRRPKILKNRGPRTSSFPS